MSRFLTLFANTRIINTDCLTFQVSALSDIATHLRRIHEHTSDATGLYSCSGNHMLETIR
ncbi:hypothetical protein SNOG_01077 [Parastagonospora nodorum SN15]|uniref:Uncharacterized protein n=1 Tax=Phaeosphaeria nodorum (strain SN15 / ATCC MYA-4574 / FGSC 10173) TaxID=321614 RepID=Q0V4I7_PHANO|nr:hypothetical protein SNOG_01077 [Parastagonospora nodorum SN15]EAT92572.1 hypothetical protein SNOG_01077 [Parastagonospora nodorum SN15]